MVGIYCTWATKGRGAPEEVPKSMQIPTYSLAGAGGGD